MVERDIDVVWGNKDQTILITKFDTGLLLIQAAFKDILRRPVLSEEEFMAMCQAGAAHFGKRFKVETIPYTCPVCGSESLGLNQSLPPGTGFVYRCRNCMVSGPKRSTGPQAVEAFKELFDEHD